jgi:predicted nucleotidyltransferase
MKISVATKTDLNKIVKQLVDAYTPEKIILFGSYAYGQPNADSDLDLLIIKRTSERFIDRWINVRRIVSDPKRSIPFEPLVLTPEELKERLAIGDQFIKEIVTKGEVLYAA